jgi:uncharacterized cupin superfamily protein
MELPAGVLVARAETTEWEPDPDVPGSEMHELIHEGPIWAGMTRVTGSPEPMTWTPEQREVAVVLEGSVRMELGDGSDVTLGVGDSFTIAAGVTTTWYVTTPFKEMWVLVED